MTKKLGYIAFKGNYPVTDGLNIIVFPTYEDASMTELGNKTKGAIRKIVSVYGAVRFSGKSIAKDA